MERNVNFMRASLLASINPLVATDIPQISGLTTIQKEAMLSIVSEEGKKTYNVEQLEADLFESVAVLNKKISHQLALIVNAEQSSSILIRQASATPHRQDKSSTITVEWKLRQPFQINVIREEYNTQDTTEELDWLYRRFSSIETSFLEEFDDRVNEAVQLIMESLALDV
jgi:hypothetical protein